MNVVDAQKVVDELTAKLKVANKNLAEAKRLERKNKAKIVPPTVFDSDFDALKKELIEAGWKVKKTNRGGKVYVTVEQTYDNYRWNPPYSILESHFASSRMTSGGCGTYTFRIN